MLEARGLVKSFGKIAAVRDVSFSARDGQITGLLGPNGAGKSTTLRMLYTVLKPDAGDAFIDGKSVAADPLAARRSIGVLSHGAGVYSNLTARENITYFGELHGLSRDERAARAAELIEMLEMQPFADRLAKGFSQGQKLKTALARALVHRPRNVLLDEPTNGLDVMAVRNLRKLLGQLARRRSLRAVLEPRHAGSRSALRRGRGDQRRTGGGRRRAGRYPRHVRQQPARRRLRGPDAWR